jgi:hypothetical protein
MSRPSTTTASAAATSARCWSTSCGAPRGTADTAETARVTSGAADADGDVHAVDLHHLGVGRRPDLDAGGGDGAATASASSGSTPASRTATVAARYMAPVSR